MGRKPVTDVKRIRISIPFDDDDVLEWFASQQSISVSIRELVRNYVEVHGTGDYFSSGRERIARAIEIVHADTELKQMVHENPVEAESSVDASAREKIMRMQGILNG